MAYRSLVREIMSRPRIACCALLHTSARNIAAALPDTARRTLRRECSRSSRRRRSRKFFNVPSEQLDSRRCLEEFSVPDPRRGISRAGPCPRLATRRRRWHTDPLVMRRPIPESYGMLDSWIPATRFQAAAGSRPPVTWCVSDWRFRRHTLETEQSSANDHNATCGREGGHVLRTGLDSRGVGHAGRSARPGPSCGTAAYTRSHDEPIHALPDQTVLAPMTNLEGEGLSLTQLASEITSIVLGR